MSADNQQATKQVISNEYLAGFTDGEGCFYVGFSKRLDLPLKWQVITEFHVSQNPGGKNVLEVFEQVLLVIEKGEHLKKEGFNRIVELVFSQQRITNKRYSKENILS